jgi:hypothetical protein
MRRFRNLLVAFVLGCSAPVLLWVGAGSAIYQERKWKVSLRRGVKNLSCSIDIDCPPGLICVDGRCQPAKTT